MRFLIWVSLASSLIACAPETTLPAKSPEPAPERQSNWKEVEPAKQKVPLVAEPAGLPAPDPSCQEFLRHETSACSQAGPAREGLAQALSLTDALARDAALSCLESSTALPPGLVRTLRAELGPVACADVLALPFLEPRRPELDRRLEDNLIALATGGRLSRLVQHAPELASPFDKARFLEFFRSTLSPWIVAQAAAIHELSLAGAHLSPYAKGVVAVEAGLADMRFVAVVRQVPLPKEMSDDEEIKEAYYAALDEALEPRKARGRDAALVGLREFANLGVLVDPRVNEARALLSQVFSGRRINALDGLMLPPLPALSTGSTERTLAALLPTFYAEMLLAEAPLDAPLLRALLERGIPTSFITRLDAAKLDELGKGYLIRALLDRGRCYFRAADFVASAQLSAGAQPSPERALYHALGSTLQSGPRDASDVLFGRPILPAGAGQVSELDHLAAEKGNPSAPLAAFDAAYVRGLAPPQSDPQFWDEQGKRFDAAERALHDAEPKKRAREASRAAKDTARALRTAAKATTKP
jgi:hypothetical protein